MDNVYKEQWYGDYVFSGGELSEGALEEAKNVLLSQATFVLKELLKENIEFIVKVNEKGETTVSWKYPFLVKTAPEEAREFEQHAESEIWIKQERLYKEKPSH